MGAYKHLNNSVVNLAQAKELSLRRKGSLAQAKSFRLSEIENREYFEFSLKLAHLAQARDLRSGEHSKPKGVELLPFSLRREFFAWVRAPRLGESFPFGRETACLGEHSRSHLLSRMQSQKSIQKLYTNYFHTIKSTSNH